MTSASPGCQCHLWGSEACLQTRWKEWLCPAPSGLGLIQGLLHSLPFSWTLKLLPWVRGSPGSPGEESNVGTSSWEAGQGCWSRRPNSEAGRREHGGWCVQLPKVSWSRSLGPGLAEESVALTMGGFTGKTLPLCWE